MGKHVTLEWITRRLRQLWHTLGTRPLNDDELSEVHLLLAEEARLTNGG